MYDESATIFTTVTVDAGRHIIPLRISHLPSSEDSESWRKHYATVKKHFLDFDRASVPKFTKDSAQIVVFLM